MTYEIIEKLFDEHRSDDMIRATLLFFLRITYHCTKQNWPSMCY